MAVNELIRRRVLTERTRERFYGRVFKLGSNDCAKVAAWHAKQFGWKVPPPGSYTDLDGAQARLAAMGCATLPDLVAKTGLSEIAPARVLLGDIVSLASGFEIGALGVALGNGLMLGFHEEAVGMAVLRMIDIERAWSVWKVRGA